MAVLRTVAIAAAACGAGCYAPDLRDCTVACAGAGDCAEGQVCGADGWCAAPEHAGACGRGGRRADAGGSGPDAAWVDAASPDGALVDAAPIDAAPPPDATIDATPIDAAPPPDAMIDAPGTTTLRLVVEGAGRLVVDRPGIACEGTPGEPGDCTFTVTAGDTLTILPVDSHPHWRFERWTTPACDDAGDTCTVDVASPGLLVGARFEAHEEGGD